LRAFFYPSDFFDSPYQKMAVTPPSYRGWSPPALP